MTTDVKSLLYEKTPVSDLKDWRGGFTTFPEVPVAGVQVMKVVCGGWVFGTPAKTPKNETTDIDTPESTEQSRKAPTEILLPVSTALTLLVHVLYLYAWSDRLQCL
jgi:hypothetical protein